MAPHCPHCEYNMTGLPSDICPECGKRYDPVLAMRRRAAAAAGGVKFRDLILLLTFMSVGNVSTWMESIGIAAIAGVWAWLRRKALRRQPMALWCAPLAFLCAEALGDAGHTGSAIAWLGVAGAIAMVESWRFGWRAPGAVAQAVGIFVAIGAGILAVAAIYRLIAGGSVGSSLQIMSVQFSMDTRSGSLLALLASLMLLACGVLLWRAGMWVSALAGKPPPPAHRISLFFRRRGAAPAIGETNEQDR